jgi:hypothetical protein
MVLKLTPHFFLGNLSLVSFLLYGPKKWVLYVTCELAHPPKALQILFWKIILMWLCLV